MSSVAVRASSRLANMLDWLESGAGLSERGSLFIRVESFVHDGRSVIRAELPGIDPNRDIQLTVQNDYLTIRAERREETRDAQHTEFHYGSFSRTVPLPAGTDPSEVTATYKDGILEVSFPMASESPEPRTIPVKRDGE